jgi:hypothetical protein
VDRRTNLLQSSPLTGGPAISVLITVKVSGDTSAQPDITVTEAISSADEY